MTVQCLAGNGYGSFSSEANMKAQALCPLTYSRHGAERTYCIGSDCAMFRSNILQTVFWCGLANKTEGVS